MRHQLSSAVRSVSSSFKANFFIFSCPTSLCRQSASDESDYETLRLTQFEGTALGQFQYLYLRARNRHSVAKSPVGEHDDISFGEVESTGSEHC